MSLLGMGDKDVIQLVAVKYLIKQAERFIELFQEIRPEDGWNLQTSHP
jgi:hypothetical protein